jgi:transketolase
MLTEQKIKELELKANDVRQGIITALVNTKTDKYGASGHTAGPLGMADIFTLLYFHVMKHDPKNPTWEGRDRLVLSNGHICPVLYSVMAYAGYFPIEELKTLRHYGSRLQGHPHREYMPWLETSSGPLGSGLSQAAGMALAERLDHGNNTSKFIYCMMSDGELQEGNTWEGVMLAGKYRLRNLIAIIDRNFIQIEGNTEDVMPLEPLADKWKSFGWHVIESSGHDMKALHEALEEAQASGLPSVIIAHVIPSKGVKAWERDYKWHGKAPTREEGALAISELQAARKE